MTALYLATSTQRASYASWCERMAAKSGGRMSHFLRTCAEIARQG